MKLNYSIFMPLGLCIFLALESAAQIRMPAPSPATNVKTSIGLTQAELNYSRPSMRGRTIFGDLVPYGEVWRTGANEPSKLSFSDEVKIGGKLIPAGQYALYTIPGKEEWTIILSSNTALWGSMGYDAKDDAHRFTVKPQQIMPAVESFTIEFDNYGSNSATLKLSWENTLVSFVIETEVDSKVMAQIKELVIDPVSDNANLLFASASYYFENNKDLKQAHEWILKATSSENAAYWVIHLRAKIEAKLGMKDEAIASANRSMDLAKKNNNPDYVRLNEKLIQDLKK
jgi:hypothetical protein